jgi:Concanavalin A-like lectin/glucanases superfamily
MARSFDGSSQYLCASSAAATAPPIAMSCWFLAQPDAVPGNYTLLALTRPYPGDERFQLVVANASTLLAAVTRDGSSFGTAVASTSYTTGVWQHAFAVWYTVTDRKVWLNGGSQGSDGSMCAPAGIAETCLGASRIGAPFSHFKGSLAEAAIWAGSGVENMGFAEAAILAKGFSPRCLGRWLGNLVLYQDLIRPANRPGTGPAMTEVGSPPSAAHPRVIYPTNQRLARSFDTRAFNPYHADAAMADAGSVVRGLAASAGVELGLTFPLGEVSI